MTYTTIRYFFPHGIEGEAMDCTFKEWKDLDKAIAYCHRYSKGRRFASVEVEDEKGNVIYELNADGEVADNREQTEKEEMTVKEAIKILEDNNYMITGQFDGWFGTIEGEYEIYDAANDYECIRSRVEEKEIIEKTVKITALDLMISAADFSATEGDEITIPSASLSHETAGAPFARRYAQSSSAPSARGESGVRQINSFPYGSSRASIVS